MFSLSEAMAAIEQKTEFSVKDRGDYIIIDYNISFKDTFLGRTDQETNILLNLRGTAFDKLSGKIIRLGWAKFHNWGEFPESDKKLDFSKVHYITEKLDGSCIFPLYTGTSGFELGTRAGVTDVSMMATKWMLNNSEKCRKYSSFINNCRTEGMVPIFEYCSRENRVVIDFPVTQMILTGIRDIETGSYLSHGMLMNISESYGIPLVSLYHPTTNERFFAVRESVSELVGDEGIVIQFANGHMIKIKSDDYCLKHKALDSLKFEKDVLLLALEGKIDDVLPLLDDATKKRVQGHTDAFLAAYLATTKLITDAYESVRNIESQKDFALEIQDSKFKSFMFAFRGKKVSFEESLMDHCKRSCGTQEKSRDMKELLSFSEVY